MSPTTQTTVQPQYYRFQIIRQNNPSVSTKPKVVGMAYLRDGHHMFTIRLWTFIKERFYLIASKNDPTSYMILSRELSQNPKKRSKYSWNIVGNGKADVKSGYIKLAFDLLDVPIFISIYPESSAHAANIPDPAYFEEAA